MFLADDAASRGFQLRQDEVFWSTPLVFSTGQARPLLRYVSENTVQYIAPAPAIPPGGA